MATKIGSGSCRGWQLWFPLPAVYTIYLPASTLCRSPHAKQIARPVSNCCGESPERVALQSRFLFVEVGEAGPAWKLHSGKPGTWPGSPIEAERRIIQHDPIAGKIRPRFLRTNHGAFRVDP